MYTTFDLAKQLPTIPVASGRLRWLDEEDVPALLEIFGDPQVTRYFGIGTLADLAAAQRLLGQIHAEFRAGTLFQWGLDIDGRIVGTCTLARLDPMNRRAELGFALGRAFQGRGYMAAALPALLEFAFEKLNLHRIVADTDPRNTPSIQVLERLGFQREGMLREHYLVEDEKQDAIVYGLLQSEWASQDPSPPASMRATLPTKTRGESRSAGE